MPYEVLPPTVSPWMEQGRYPSCVRIDSRNVRTLIAITIKAGESEIVLGRSPAVLVRDYVINLKWK
jgi:hypothetical protein